MSKITYDNKVDLNVDNTIANINKVSASDMNEIKNVVNGNDDILAGMGNIENLTTTDKSSVVNAINELNAPEKWVAVGKTAPTDGRRVWFAKSANLFNKSSRPFYNYDATYTELTTGVKATLTNAGTNRYFAMRLDATKVLGKTLNLSATITPSGTNNGAIRFYFTNDSSLSSVIDGRLTTTGSAQITFPSTIPSGSDGVAIVFSANLNSTTSQVNNYVEYTNVMLQEGSASYEPYIEEGIYVDNENIYQSASNNYSSFEQVIGKWINGKPLYRKVIDFGSMPNNTSKDVAHGITNLSRIITFNAIMSNNSTNFPIPIAQPSNTSLTAYAYVTNTNVHIETTTNRSSYTAFVILEYIKTTD